MAVDQLREHHDPAWAPMQAPMQAPIQAPIRAPVVRRAIGPGAAAKHDAIERTPGVRAAIESLLTEAAELRDQHHRALNFSTDPQKPANEETLLPVVDRRAFVRALSRSMASAQWHGMPYTLVCFVVDDMNGVSEQFGHAAEDAVREHVAGTLVSRTRRTDVVGRLGGDEFAVILGQADEPTGRKKARSLADQIAAHPVPWNGREIAISTSFGAWTLKGR